MLYVSSGGDTTVAPANTADCAAVIRAHGGDVQMVKLGHTDHNNSAMLALPQVLSWFSSLR